MKALLEFLGIDKEDLPEEEDLLVSLSYVGKTIFVWNDYEKMKLTNCRYTFIDIFWCQC